MVETTTSDDGDQPQMPNIPKGRPAREVLLTSSSRATGGRMAKPHTGMGPGLRLPHLVRRLHRDQQSRRRERDGRRGRDAGRQDDSRDRRRNRQEDRSRAPQAQDRLELSLRAVGGLRTARRRLGDRGRQSVRSRRDGHGRYRLGPGPRHRAPAPTTTSCRSTHPSTAAIRAARPSTRRVRSSASTPPSSRRRAAASASASPSRPRSRRASSRI